MTSSSASDYRKHCADLILRAVKRPGMYYRKLWDLEMLLWGHWMAFEQISGLERSRAFNPCLSAWLHETRGVSVSSGWTDAIIELAEEANCDCDGLFAELVNEFLAEWVDG